VKRQIRRNVFETNSSSTHSFSHGGAFNNIIVEDDGFVHTNLGEFGWEIRNYYDSEAKLAYILLVAASFTDHSFWYFENGFNEELKSFKCTDLYKDIEDVVKDHMNCDGIEINKNSEGYIDHQSLEYDSFNEWLYDTGASSIEDFIFGDIVLHTDNDNH
jgi:hypothetical protein